MIYFKEIRMALMAIKYTNCIPYIVVTFWYLLYWSKFKKYAEGLKQGMSWRFSYEKAWDY